MGRNPAHVRRPEARRARDADDPDADAAGRHALGRLTGSGETALSAFLHHTFLANVAGIPALTVPCGFSDESLPIGLQLYGRPFGEPTIFRIGHAYESATDWHLRRPEVGRVAA